MTEQEQRIAIAEACGWRRSGSNELGIWVSPAGKPAGNIPDYLHDLNAMHEAEKVLDDNINDASSKRYVYADLLYRIVPKEQQPMRATATQRSEAFLRTIGKWKD